MTKLSGRCASVVAISVALGACLTGPLAREAKPDRAKTDEVTIRRMLAETERRINASDPGFVEVFAKDAVIITPAAPDIIGFESIRTLYTETLKQTSMEVHFSTEEVAIAGDLAYERGTYTLKMSDRASGKVLQDVKNKHIHILRRQTNGHWKTWRMMVTSAVPQTNK
jgi:ketosteroid isomerase-like protein